MNDDPSRSPQESYHVQHAPFGAFASFTIGLVGGTGGFGQSLRGPARQNVYIGFRRGQGLWNLLPYFTPPKSNESAFTGEAAVAQAPSDVRVLSAGDFQRSLGWASDTWRAEEGRFGFCLTTPFTHTADPARMNKAEARQALSPHVNGWIEFDNTGSREDAELVFGIGDPDQVFRPVQDSEPSLVGFAVGTAFGYITKPALGVSARQGFDIFHPKHVDHRGLLLIGGESGLFFRVPAGQRRRFPLVLGFYQAGIVTTGISACYAYSRVFRNLEDVLGHGLRLKAHYERVAALRDRELERSKLDSDQRFLLAQSTHSYLGSTQLLWGEDGPLWVVNEGEYRMMNTFDLTVDHLFFELEWLPWGVRNALDLFLSRYSYNDRIKHGGKCLRGGISFTHDMGVMNNFTPPGHSSYECDNLEGCFSHMTLEQLLNWILCAVTYAEKAGDLRWLRQRRATLLACAESLSRRDHPTPSQRNGIPKLDSARCGSGAEITTYDSLDVSLGQARNNLYLSVKALGAWILLEKAFRDLGLDEESQEASESARLLAASLEARFETDTRLFPAVFEKGNVSRIIPAVEGFVYPLFLGLDEACDRHGRFGPLLALLSEHLRGILRPGVCLDPVSGGWKMSSTSRNTWFSKIAISQHVIRRLFPEAMTLEARAGDQVHADWQRRPGCGANAMCDQILSDTGLACGSRYYPRGVSACLWLLE